MFSFFELLSSPLDFHAFPISFHDFHAFSPFPIGLVSPGLLAIRMAISGSGGAAESVANAASKFAFIYSPRCALPIPLAR